MHKWLARVEGVNFSATILDTNDLSTIRGGGLALLYFHEVVEQALEKIEGKGREQIYAGASQCAYVFTRGGDEQAITDALRKAIDENVRDRAERKDRDAPPFHWLMTVVDVVHFAGEAGPDPLASCERRTLECAEARNHARQFRQWTVAPIAFNGWAKDADPLDRISPATLPAYFPKGKFGETGASHEEDAFGDADSGKFDLHPVAPSVFARREYGRRNRQKFYGRMLQGKMPQNFLHAGPPLRFTDDLQAMVAAPQGVNGLSLKNKIAVVYADGNKFGALVKKPGVSIKEFSAWINLKRNDLLAAVLEWHARGAGGENYQPFAILGTFDRSVVKRCRFETILWGADELAFVMPSWLATAFVEGFFAVTRAWPAFHGDKITHALGVAIGDRKTPIRQLRAIAKHAADAAKDATLGDRQPLREHDSVTFEIFESLAPPDDDLAAWRASLYGDGPQLKALPLHLALPGGAFGAAIEAMRHLTAKFPRSQVYSALRKLREERVALTDPGADGWVNDAIDGYLRGAGADKGFTNATLTLPAVAGIHRGAALDLALVATLWDYADPFAGQLPKFGAPAGKARP